MSNLAESRQAFLKAINDANQDQADRIVMLEKQLKESQEARLKNLRELLRLKKIMQQQPEMTAIQIENEKLKQKIQSMQKNQDQYEQYIEELTTTREELEKLKDTLQSYTVSSEQIEQIRIENEKYFNKNNNSDDGDSHTNNEKLVKEIAELKEENIYLRQQLAEQRESGEEAFEKAEELEKSLNEMKKSANTSEIPEENKDEIISNLKSRIEFMQQRLDALDRKEAPADAGTLWRENRDLREENLALKQQISAADGVDRPLFGEYEKPPQLVKFDRNGYFKLPEHFNQIDASDSYHGEEEGESGSDWIDFQDLQGEMTSSDGSN